MYQLLKPFSNNGQLVAIAFIALFSFGNVSAQATEAGMRGMSSAETTEATHELVGKASFYGDEYQGRKAANGEIFDNTQFTAAHKTLPFGTMVKVIRKDNGKSVTVRITDRGPFKTERIIDLAQAAAIPIGLVRDGVTDVSVEIISSPYPVITAMSSTPQTATATAIAVNATPSKSATNVADTKVDKPAAVAEKAGVKYISAPQQGYGVQVGSYSDMNRAERITQDFAKNGVNNLVIHTGTSKDNEVVFRVIVGPFEAREEAINANDLLKGTETKGFVIDMNNLK